MSSVQIQSEIKRVVSTLKEEYGVHLFGGSLQTEKDLEFVQGLLQFYQKLFVAKSLLRAREAKEEPILTPPPCVAESRYPTLPPKVRWAETLEDVKEIPPRPLVIKPDAPSSCVLRPFLIRMAMEKKTVLDLPDGSYLRKKSASKTASLFVGETLVSRYAIPRPNRCLGTTASGARCKRKMFKGQVCSCH